MTTRTFAPILPIEVRRQLWLRLWQEIILRPLPFPLPPKPPQDDDEELDEAA